MDHEERRYINCENALAGLAELFEQQSDRESASLNDGLATVEDELDSVLAVVRTLAN